MKEVFISYTDVKTAARYSWDGSIFAELIIHTPTKRLHSEHQNY